MGKESQKLKNIIDMPSIFNQSFTKFYYLVCKLLNVHDPNFFRVAPQ